MKMLTSKYIKKYLYKSMSLIKTHFHLSYIILQIFQKAGNMIFLIHNI